jgi:hypothetical protein
MDIFRALGKVAVASLVVTFWGVAPGCGPSIGAYCNKVCDCVGCSDSQRDDCIDDADDARKAAENKGCRGQFDDLLSCGANELECKDGYTQTDGCDSEVEAYNECMIGTPSTSSGGGYGGEGAYGGYGGEGAWGGGDVSGPGGSGAYGGYGGSGAYGGYGGSGAAGGFGGAGGGGGGPCLGCGEYISTDDPSAMLCEGTSMDLYNELTVCVCEGLCAGACGDNLCSGSSPTSQCQQCVLDEVEGCGIAYAQCANDF